MPLRLVSGAVQSEVVSLEKAALTLLGQDKKIEADSAAKLKSERVMPPSSVAQSSVPVHSRVWCSKDPEAVRHCQCTAQSKADREGAHGGFPQACFPLAWSQS